MPLFELISDRLRCCGLGTDIYPFHEVSVEFNKSWKPLKPVEVMALEFFGDPAKIAEMEKNRIRTTVYKGVKVCTTAAIAIDKDEGAIRWNIPVERVTDALRDIVHGPIVLVKDEESPPVESAQARFLVTCGYSGDEREHPSYLEISPGPALDQNKWIEVVKSPHTLGLAGWISGKGSNCLGFLTPVKVGKKNVIEAYDPRGYRSDLSWRRREFELEKRVTLHIGDKQYVFGLNGTGTFYRGTLLPDGTLSPTGAWISMDTPVVGTVKPLFETIERKESICVSLNEKLPRTLTNYLVEHHSEMLGAK